MNSNANYVTMLLVALLMMLTTATSVKAPGEDYQDVDEYSSGASAGADDGDYSKDGEAMTNANAEDYDGNTDDRATNEIFLSYLCRTDPNIPQLTINQRRPDYWKQPFHYRYGGSVIIHCSAENTSLVNLGIQDNGEFLQFESINATTIQSRVTPTVGHHTYSCKNRKTGCKESQRVTVTPAMTVESSRVRRIFHDESIYEYLVLFGDDYEVLCSGHDSETLSLRRTPNDDQHCVDIVDRTTIKYKAKADSDAYYWCTDKTRAYTITAIHTGFYPECQQFQCFIHSYLKLDCSWSYFYPRKDYGTLYKFTLFYKDDNDASERQLVANMPGDKTTTFTWDIRQKNIYLKFEWNYKFSLILMTCYAIVCNNQTFEMNTNSIMKPTPVSYLHFEDPVISFYNPNIDNLIGGVNDFLIRVDYRTKTFEEERWRRAKTLAVHCSIYDLRYCKLEIALPYPETKYEIRVYTRYNNTGDGLWSDPTNADVETKSRAKCKCKLSAMPANKTIYSKTACEVCALSGDMTEEFLAMIKYKNTWKLKLAKIKALINLKALGLK